ncbi:MAG: zinc ribbon domain-containing protein [Bacteroidetes bacterium]|nr:zinc ribbon domain-containing protein [Bacteroidota bacterium]
MSENIPVRRNGHEQFEGLIECDRCKTYNYRSSKYCLYCGADLARRCGRCGAEVADRLALYCTECGTALAKPSGQQ